MRAPGDVVKSGLAVCPDAEEATPRASTAATTMAMGRIGAIPRRPPRAVRLGEALESDGSHAVQGLGVREPLEFQLLDQALPGERLHLQVLLGFSNGLLHPVRARMASPVPGVARREPLEFQLLGQALLGERLELQVFLRLPNSLRP